jgi:hypothetical protein
VSPHQHRQMTTSAAPAAGVTLAARSRVYGGKFSRGFGAFMRDSELADVTVVDPSGTEHRAHTCVVHCSVVEWWWGEERARLLATAVPLQLPRVDCCCPTTRSSSAWLSARHGKSRRSAVLCWGLRTRQVCGNLVYGPKWVNSNRDARETSVVPSLCHSRLDNCACRRVAHHAGVLLH